MLNNYNINLFPHISKDIRYSRNFKGDEITINDLPSRSFDDSNFNDIPTINKITKYDQNSKLSDLPIRVKTRFRGKVGNPNRRVLSASTFDLAIVGEKESILVLSPPSLPILSPSKPTPTTNLLQKRSGISQANPSKLRHVSMPLPHKSSNNYINIIKSYNYDQNDVHNIYKENEINDRFSNPEYCSSSSSVSSSCYSESSDYESSSSIISDHESIDYKPISSNNQSMFKDLPPIPKQRITSQEIKKISGIQSNFIPSAPIKPYNYT
ncbi:hypothetical protein WICMUC_001692 [Wickerhamomyces mucosus]|uniref:Uncharacterized protein n=1 Tax=Wickerhamomyces mucosus TaxID=1378264 RepID=A0A9P8PTM2_9ASCO|nr:hypothetical protein WICMUC_001692 [Wickerhamomyces mucosus]